MNGPEHYAEAERLMTTAGREFGDCDPADPSPLWALTIAEAQVHATLALAAATQARIDPVATCGHGLTGLCMHCLIPVVEHSLGRQA